MRIDEQNFIKALRRKNENALNYVVDNYGALVKAIVRKHLGVIKNYEEECINDVFLAVWYGIENFDFEKGNFKNWIGAIAKYKAIGYKRKYLESAFEDDVNNIELKDFSFENEVKKQELKEEVENLLSCLKKEDKKIFEDYYIKDKSIKEISEKINKDGRNIYNRLSRGKKKLRLLFKEI